MSPGPQCQRCTTLRQQVTMHIRDYEVCFDEATGCWQILRSFGLRRGTSLLIALPGREAIISVAEGLCSRICEKGYTVGLVIRTQTGAIASDRVFGAKAAVARQAS